MFFFCITLLYHTVVVLFILIIYPFSVFFLISLAYILVIYVFVLDLVYACLEGAVSTRARLYRLEHFVSHETTINAHSNVDR